MMPNLAVQPDRDKTARTDPECARQRLEHLSMLVGAERVLELCVGPSLRTFEHQAEALEIEVWGNDLDKKWRDYHKRGKWILGDALEVARKHGRDFDAVVFAPPLTKGCTGKREDSFMIDQVYPRYEDFLPLAKTHLRAAVLVLPGRSTRTQPDREQYFKLMDKVYRLERRIEVITLTSTRNAQKYVDVYIY